MKHRLTVLLTVFNIEEYLPRFFECMQRQTFSDYCLLVIDDGSTDRSLDICRQYAEKDDRIKIVELEHVGISEARNIGIRLVDTPLTAFADGDDYFDDDYLKHLVNAFKKHDADLVISRVVHLQEGKTAPHYVHPARGETLITKPEFNEKIPMLLDDKRLNFLYSKLFRTELLQQLRVESDVKQGSDTMFVFQYLDKANSIVLIDDADYHYINYLTRSVTAYIGTDAYERIIRINKFIRTFSTEHGMMTEELDQIIDGRILVSAIGILRTIIGTDMSDREKAEIIDSILNNKEYFAAYNRRKDHFDIYRFTPIEPQNGEKYFKKTVREQKRMAAKGKVIHLVPGFVLNAYRKVFK